MDAADKISILRGWEASVCVTAGLCSSGLENAKSQNGLRRFQVRSRANIQNSLFALNFTDLLQNFRVQYFSGEQD